MSGEEFHQAVIDGPMVTLLKRGSECSQPPQILLPRDVKLGRVYNHKSPHDIGKFRDRVEEFYSLIP